MKTKFFLTYDDPDGEEVYDYTQEVELNSATLVVDFYGDMVESYALKEILQEWLDESAYGKYFLSAVEYRGEFDSIILNLDSNLAVMAKLKFSLEEVDDSLVTDNHFIRMLV